MADDDRTPDAPEPGDTKPPEPTPEPTPEPKKEPPAPRFPTLQEIQAGVRKEVDELFDERMRVEPPTPPEPPAKPTGDQPAGDGSKPPEGEKEPRAKTFAERMGF